VLQPQQSSVRNGLLAALAPDDFGALQPWLEPMDLKLRDTLVEPHKPIEHVYFMERGITSIINNSRDGKVEIGIIGREGMVGVPILLGTDRTPHEFFVQIEGSGLRMEARRLAELADQSVTLRRALLRFAQAISVQTSQTAFGNASNSVESRLARWLLMCHDRIDGDDIPLTHEFIAMMLGVRRAGVTVTTHILEGNGLIRARRGTITVLDRERLEELADDAYGVPEAEYKRLMSED
jgi:CRP-like cAMP-binding protein